MDEVKAKKSHPRQTCIGQATLSELAESGVTDEANEMSTTALGGTTRVVDRLRDGGLCDVVELSRTGTRGPFPQCGVSSMLTVDCPMSVAFRLSLPNQRGPNGPSTAHLPSLSKLPNPNSKPRPRLSPFTEMHACGTNAAAIN